MKKRILGGALLCLLAFGAFLLTPSSPRPPASSPDERRPAQVASAHQHAATAKPAEPESEPKEGAQTEPREADATGTKAKGATLEDEVKPPVLHEGEIVVGLRALVEGARHIVLGRVISKRALWNEARTAIYTEHTVRVRTWLKGDLQSKSITLRVIGGEIPGENVKLQVSHQPKLPTGVEGLFFIHDEPGRHSSLVAGSQGFLAVTRPTPDESRVHDGFGRSITGLTSALGFETAAEGVAMDPELLMRKIRAMGEAR